MKVIFSILVIQFTLLLLAGCNRKVCPEISTATNDSSITKIITVPNDTTIILPGDAVEVTDTLPCPELNYRKEAVSKSGNMKASISISKGKLDVACNTDSLEKVITWYESQLMQENYKTITVAKTVTKKEYKIPKWLWYVLLASLSWNAWNNRKGLLSIIKTFISRWIKS